MIDVAVAIDAFATSIVLKSNADGSYDDNGNWVAGDMTPTTISATIQPAKGRQLEDLPEGIRSEAGWLVWSRHMLETDQVIEHQSRNYRVLHVWPRDLGGFTRAALGLTE
jgi:hypothetical protein